MPNRVSSQYAALFNEPTPSPKCVASVTLARGEERTTWRLSTSGASYSTPCPGCKRPVYVDASHALRPASVQCSACKAWVLAP
jgi:hypothetical protein